jgi:glycosyltransferase involved in cell wall biosynthesis
MEAEPGGPAPVADNGAMSPPQGAPEVSIVMPCLDEADTVAACVRAARRGLEEAGLSGEVVVSDNGSTDGSPSIAEREGARVVRAGERGYGSALMAGIRAARGRYVVMADADASYDLADAPRFVEKLREGFDLVQGCRLSSGGGTVEAGAMPWLHRWWGNPMFSALARRWFHIPLHDLHCGMRGFSRELFDRLDLRCTGMEFASEMVIRATLSGARLTELPITLRPDGRRSHPPHLRTFRDGWRHLRFLLVYSPRWLFLVPGLLLIAAGLLGYAIAMPRLSLAGIVFDVHTLLFASLALICGYQAVLFGAFTKVFAITEGLLPADRRLERLFARIDLEKGLAVGALVMLAGLGLLGAAVNLWRTRLFGDLDYEKTMRWVIPGVTLSTLGFQTILSSFFLSILGLKRR